jgi:type II secretion system protein G
MLKNSKRFSGGFTLVELLVVIAILGILVTIGLTSFTSAQIRGRDAQRKSDLKQVSTALELYYSDYGRYPAASSGKIAGCTTVSAGPCDWGVITSEFTDNKTIYMKVVPGDPTTGANYYYRTVTVNSVDSQGFQLYAKLENSRDLNCLPDAATGKPNCASPPTLPAGVTCGGSGSCNFSVTSSNVTATQE